MQLKFDNASKIHNYALPMHNYLVSKNSNEFDSGPLQLGQNQRLSASIVGARGYSGLELAKLLIKHPYIEFTHAFATQDFNLSDELLSADFDQVECLADSEILENLTDLVFLATPAEVSLKLAPQILKKGKSVIDLSGAFRLKQNDYMKWYGFSHTEAELLANATYGLQPLQILQNDFSRPQLIANPGCYATAILMALVPLLKANLISTEGIVIDAKSGTSGAGRKAQENLLFTEVDGECLPYKVGRHQHLPEVKESIERLCGQSFQPHLTTHLLSTPRGIIAGIYAQSKTLNPKDIADAFVAEYQNYSLVKVSQKISQYASLKKVIGTPFTHISFELVEDKLYLFSCIDNLLKGAASQAVENLNQLLGLPLEFSLIHQANKKNAAQIAPNLANVTHEAQL
jgi:N-acetyl-gamma-glutamyl-phosphate reductase